MIATIDFTGIRAFVNIRGSTTSEVFGEFVIQRIVPVLSPGSIVVMDNLKAHKDKRAISETEKAENEYVYAA